MRMIGELTHLGDTYLFLISYKFNSLSFKNVLTCVSNKIIVGTLGEKESFNSLNFGNLVNIFKIVNPDLFDLSCLNDKAP